MLEAPGRLLPRALSLCLAPPGELAFLIDPIGPGTRALCALERGDAIHVFGPLGHGFRLDVERPLLVGGGIGIAPLPYLAEALRFPPAVLGFRSERHAEAAALLPGAELAIDPALVTELIPAGHDVLACGPEPMLDAIAAQCPGAQLAWEAPMACGYGGCYGCAVEIERRAEAAVRRRSDSPSTYSRTLCSSYPVGRRSSRRRPSCACAPPSEKSRSSATSRG